MKFIIDAVEGTGGGTTKLLISYTCVRTGSVVVHQEKGSLDCSVATIIAALYIAANAYSSDDLKSGFFHYQSRQ